jgi:hypothetical protein
MAEFRDDINRQWINAFDGFETEFPDLNSWERYIQKMINSDKSYVKALMKPHGSMLRTLRVGEDSIRVRVQYTHEVQPRKLAHQLLTIREDVSNEVIKDLNSIKIEHTEAMRYGTNLVASGKEYADKNRRDSRMRYQSGSTPLRDKTFTAVSTLVRIHD